MIKLWTEEFRSWLRRDPAGWLAFSAYLGLAILVCVPPMWGRFSITHIGNGADPAQFMWCLVWWPHAVSHWLNPFLCNAIWAPAGINLTWTKSLPLPALIMWPVTALFGPIAAYNVMMLLGVPLAEWTAFLLCRSLSKSWWPSLLGGYVYGSSSYFFLEEYAGHPGCVLVFVVPLAALAVALAIKDEISNRTLIAALTAILTAQFLISIEIFATMTMIGAMTLAFGWLFAPAEAARRIAKAALWILFAYLLTAIIVSPYLYWMFAYGWPRGELFPWLERHMNSSVLTILPGSNYQLLAIALAFVWTQWRTPLGKTLIGSSLMVSMLMWPPQVHIAGFTCPTPAGIVMALPLINKALPYRYGMYGSLLLGIMAAIWFGSNRLNWKLNLAIAAIVISSLLPGRFSKFVKPDKSPAFFTTGVYHDYLKPDENVLVLPFGYIGNGMLWQAETGMYFRMVGGSIGLYPAEFNDWPIFTAFTTATYLPDAAGQLGAFMAHYQVDAVVVADSDPDAKYWNELVSSFAGTNSHAGGVTVHRILLSAVEPYRQVTAIQMRRRAAQAAVDSLMLAAGQWLSAGNSLSELTPFEALQHGFLKASWCVGPTTGYFTGQNEKAANPHSHHFCRIGLGGTSRGLANLGVYGSYADFEPIIDRYRKDAAHIFFPYPHDLLSLGTPTPPPGRLTLLEMEFAQDRIATIAAQLKSPPPP